MPRLFARCREASGVKLAVLDRVAIPRPPRGPVKPLSVRSDCTCSGKSLTAALLLLHRALFADLSALRTGQRGVGLLVAPDTRLDGIPLSYVRGIIST